MRRKLLWTFVVMVALLDLVVAWIFRASFREIELNPIAIEVHGIGGLAGLTVYRLTLLCFSGLMSTTKTKLSFLIFPLLVGTHAILCAILVISLLLILAP